MLGASTAALALQSTTAQAAPVVATTSLPSSVAVVSPSGGNDSPQVQAAVDRFATKGQSGDVWFNSGTYRFDQTVYVPYSTITGTVVNLKGLGNVVIAGAASPLMQVESQWGYSIDGLSFQGSGQKGIGLWLSRATGGGTNGGQAIISRVNVAGFATGCRLGTSGGTATSEILFSGCSAKSNTIGFEPMDYNTLDLKFDMLSLGANDYGIFTNTAGQVTVDGGSASNNRKADFHFGTGGVFAIRNFRSEGTMRLFEPGTTTATTVVTIESCEVEGVVSPDHIVVQGNWGDGLTIIGCDLAGTIGWGQVYGLPFFPGRLVMIGTSVQDTQPFRPIPDGEGLRYTIIGCRGRNPDNTVSAQFDDQTGTVHNGQLVRA